MRLCKLLTENEEITIIIIIRKNVGKDSGECFQF